MKQHVVIYLENGKREEALLPVDVPMHRLVPVLVRKLKLPPTGLDGHPLTYHLELYRNGRRLSDEQTLRQGRVTEKTRLKLVGEQMLPPSEPPTPDIHVAPQAAKLRQHPQTPPAEVTTEALAAELRRRVVNRLPTFGIILGGLVLIWLMAHAYSDNQTPIVQSLNTPTPSTYQFTRSVTATPTAADFPTTTPYFATGVPTAVRPGVTLVFEDPATVPTIPVLPTAITLPVEIATATAQIVTNAAAPFSDAPTFPFTAHLGAGMVREFHYAIIGPDAGVDCGDPFSSFNSPYHSDEYVNPRYPGHYSYHYRIEIPRYYPYDVVRVELFDPDSINQATGDETVEIQHAAAYTASSGAALPIKACEASVQNQTEPCILTTGESYNTNSIWFVRVDKNRIGTENGCQAPESYDRSVNTQTAFDLYYVRLDGNDKLERVPIATYLGQTGTEEQNHDTDLRWVSPGGTPSSDQPVFVPVSAGPSTFEVTLSTLADLPTDPVTLDRYLYLDVTALSGASENGYAIWAGPPTGTAALDPDNPCAEGVPSQVNERNLHIIDCALFDRSAGVIVQSLGVTVLNSNTNQPVDIPLRYVSAGYAGKQMYVSLFDADSGQQSPVAFYFDWLGLNKLQPGLLSSPLRVDYSYLVDVKPFAVNGSTTGDPDLESGMERNCTPGNCQSMWISPAYRLDISGSTMDCEFNFDMYRCRSAYGGWLVARYHSAIYDTYAWLVLGPELPPQE